MTNGNNHIEETQDRRAVVHDLIQESHIGKDFYFLLIVSTLITTLGLSLGNGAVIIGGMLIAPLLSPILALGLGIVTANQESLIRSTLTIIKSVGIVLVLSIVTSFIVGIYSPNNPEIVSRIRPSLPYVYIAFLSGIAATYSWAKPKLSATLPGVAVVVALLPPLCTTGIGISEINRDIVAGSFQLFLINLLGIASSAAIVFSLLGYHQMRWIEKKEIDKEKEETETKVK
ncbi:TIGR00341 family protein [candidate division WWE3 bacterium]|uniref:TIGR00341 family protein n=1 Tax=candidate division WWE3 bacterium TaxID=2053526 RepID=A0A955RPU6_UNCKA|nr:TIGR00341 family protein [candidate division WWE3 bacterium]